MVESVTNNSTSAVVVRKLPGIVPWVACGIEDRGRREAGVERDRGAGDVQRREHDLGAADEQTEHHLGGEQAGQRERLVRQRGQRGRERATRRPAGQAPEQPHAGGDVDFAKPGMIASGGAEAHEISSRRKASSTSTRAASQCG
jgi:hypothetical protein